MALRSARRDTRWPKCLLFLSVAVRVFAQSDAPLVAVEPYDVGGPAGAAEALVGTARSLADELNRAGVPAFASGPLDGRMRPWPESVRGIVRVGVQLHDERSFTATLAVYRPGFHRGMPFAPDPSDDAAAGLGLLERIVDQAWNASPERIRLTPALHAERVRRVLARLEPQNGIQMVRAPEPSSPGMALWGAPQTPFSRTNPIPPAIEALLATADACIEVLPVDPGTYDPALVEQLTGGTEFFRDWLRKRDLPVLPAGVTNGSIAYRMRVNVRSIDQVFCTVNVSLVRTKDGSLAGGDTLRFSRDHRRPGFGGSGGSLMEPSRTLRPLIQPLLFDQARFAFSPVSSNLIADAAIADAPVETDGRTRALRVALVPTRHDPASEALAARLLVLMGGDAAVEFVDRDQVIALLDQQRLALASIARAVGRTLRADLVIPITVTSNGVEMAGLATRDGTVLQAKLAPAPDREQAALEALRTLLHQARTLKADTPRISMSRFVNRDIDGTYARLEGFWTERVTEALRQRSDVVLTERSRLSLLEEEFRTAGASPPAALRGDLLVLGDFSVDRSGAERRVSLELRLVQPGLRTETVQFPVPDGEAPDLPVAMARCIAERAAGAPPADAATAAKEAEAFFARGTMERDHGRLREAIPPLEAAILLQPERRDFREALWSTRTNLLATWTKKDKDLPIHTVLFWLESIGDAVVRDAAEQARDEFPPPDVALLLRCAGQLPDHPAIQRLAARAVQGEFEARRARFMANPGTESGSRFRAAADRMVAAGSIHPASAAGAAMIVAGMRAMREAHRLWPETDDDALLVRRFFQAGRGPRFSEAFQLAARTLADDDDPLLRVVAIRAALALQILGNGGLPYRFPQSEPRVRHPDTNDTWLVLAGRELAINGQGSVAAWSWMGRSAATFATYWKEANGVECPAFGALAGVAITNHGRAGSPGVVLFCEALAGAWFGLPEAYGWIGDPAGPPRTTDPMMFHTVFDCRWAEVLGQQAEWWARNNPAQFRAAALSLSQQLARQTGCPRALAVGRDLMARAPDPAPALSKRSFASVSTGTETPAPPPPARPPLDYRAATASGIRQGWPAGFQPDWEAAQGLPSGQLKVLFVGGGIPLFLSLGTFDADRGHWTFAGTARLVRTSSSAGGSLNAIHETGDAWRLLLFSNECFAISHSGGVVHFGPKGEARELTDEDGLPARSVTCLAAAGPDLFFTGHRGGVGRWNRASRSWQQLFGSRMATNDHPLNGGRPYDVLALGYDPVRTQLIVACRGDRGGVWKCPLDDRPASRCADIPQPDSALAHAGVVAASGREWFRLVDPRRGDYGFGLTRDGNPNPATWPRWKVCATPVAHPPQFAQTATGFVFLGGSTLYIGRPNGEIRPAEIEPPLSRILETSHSVCGLYEVGTRFLIVGDNNMVLLEPANEPAPLIHSSR